MFFLRSERPFRNAARESDARSGPGMMRCLLSHTTRKSGAAGRLLLLLSNDVSRDTPSEWRVAQMLFTHLLCKGDVRGEEAFYVPAATCRVAHRLTTARR